LHTVSDSCTRLANVNNQGGYTIVYGTDCADGGIDFSIHPARGAFEAALGDWVEQTNFNVRIGTAQDAKTPTLNTCLVRFDNNKNSLQDYFLGGVLGTCASSLTICGNKLPVLERFEIVFQRPNSSNSANKIFWDYCTTPKPPQVNGSQTYSLRTVALHELGHGIGFDHITEQKRIMFAYASDKMTGLLYEEDIEGARYIRQKSDLLTCKKPMNNNVLVPKVKSGCGETENAKISLFQGRYDPAVIVLNGQLLANTNAINIQVERSQNNRCFDSIGIISTKNIGTSLFIFTDKNISGGNLWYYRLRLTLSDSSVVFSEVISVNITEKQKKIVIAPNPIQDRLSVRFDFLYSTTIEASFYDLSGRMIAQQKVEPNGTAILELETKFLTAGMYILHLRTERGIIYKGKVCKM
jgi:Matrixin/Secretion system C-terminal sorting domain